MDGANYACRLCQKKITLKSGDMIRCKNCEGVTLIKLQTPGVRKYVAR